MDCLSTGLNTAHVTDWLSSLLFVVRDKFGTTYQNVVPKVIQNPLCKPQNKKISKYYTLWPDIVV